MPPAKKAATPAKTKSLSDYLNDKEDDKATPVDEPVAQQVNTEDPNNVDVEGNPRVVTNTMPDSTAGKTTPYIGEDGQVTTNPVWQENPEHNLGMIHPDVLPQPGPQHQTQTSRMVYVTEFAGVNENDDKGFPERDADEIRGEEEYTSEFAPENSNDDKNLKRDVEE